MGNAMALSAALVKCSRCKSTEHATVECPKPFMRPMCSYCRGMGHVDNEETPCPGRLLRDRREVRVANTAALVCFHCNGKGHVKAKCPQIDVPKCFECGSLGHRQANCEIRKARLDVEKARFNADRTCFSCLPPYVLCLKRCEMSRR